MSDSKKDAGIIDQARNGSPVDAAALSTSQAGPDPTVLAEKGPNLPSRDHDDDKCKSAAAAVAISAATQPLIESSQQTIRSTGGAAANASDESSTLANTTPDAAAKEIKALQEMVRKLQKQLSEAELQISDEKKKSEEAKNRFLDVVGNLSKRLELLEHAQCAAQKEETIRLAKREEEETKSLDIVVDGFAAENDKWRKAFVTESDQWRKTLLEQSKKQQEEETNRLPIERQDSVLGVIMDLAINFDDKNRKERTEQSKEETKRLGLVTDLACKALDKENGTR